MTHPDTFVPPGRIAKRFGVTTRTVGRWADGLTEGADYIRTPGGHRRIAEHVVVRWATEHGVAA